MTDTDLNDVYCVKTKNTATDTFIPTDDIYCYAVGNNGLVRFTSNGGDSPWRTRFSGVQENLRKIVIIQVRPSMPTGVSFSSPLVFPGLSVGPLPGLSVGPSRGLDFASPLTHDVPLFITLPIQVTHAHGGNGDHAVAIGDNGRVIRTSDGGNTWEKLERTTPEHLVAIQFNAFDDYYYAVGGSDLTPEYTFFEGAEGKAMPFGNGVATGTVLYDWMARTGSCGVGSPNSGSANARYYDCKKPEVSIVLRTNCQSTLASQHWRCQPECVDPSATAPVALEATLASDEVCDAYFATSRFSCFTHHFLTSHFLLLTHPAPPPPGVERLLRHRDGDGQRPGRLAAHRAKVPGHRALRKSARLRRGMDRRPRAGVA